MRLVFVLAGVVLALAGCSTTGTGGPSAAAAVAPAPHSAPTLDTPRPTETAATYPNINKVPSRPKTKLMTPDETQKVIAELEALAKAQGTPVARTSQKVAAACNDKVAQALDPEASIQREHDGQTC